MEERTLPLTERPLDILLVSYLLIHLPIALLLDGQMFFPKHWYPAFLTDVVQWHIDTNGDYLCRDVPAFFYPMVVCEFLIQLPLHIACAYAFIAGKKWGRVAGIIYGVHTATTMVPIFGDMLSRVPPNYKLVGIYIPYLLLPLIIVARLLPYEDPFAAPVEVSRHKKRT